MQQHVALLRVASPSARGSWRQQRLLGQRYQLGFASRWRQGGQTWFGFAATAGVDLALAVRNLLGGQQAQGVYVAYQAASQTCSVIIWLQGKLVCSVMIPYAELSVSLSQWLAAAPEPPPHRPLSVHSVGFSLQQQQLLVQSIDCAAPVSWQHHQALPRKLRLRGCYLRSWRFGQSNLKGRWTLLLMGLVIVMGMSWWLSRPAPEPKLSASALAQQQQQQREHAQYQAVRQHGVSPAALVAELPWLLRFSQIPTWQIQSVSLAALQLNLTMQSRFADLRNLSTLHEALVQSPASWQVKGAQVQLYVPLQQTPIETLITDWEWRQPTAVIASMLAQLPQQLRHVLPSIGTANALPAGLRKTKVELQFSQQSWVELEALLLLLADYPVRLVSLQLQPLPHGWQGQLQLDLITRDPDGGSGQPSTMKE